MLSVLRAAAVLSACTLAACVSQSPRTAQAPAAPRIHEAPPRIVTDSAYVARVGREARRRGLALEWINPPLRQTAGD
ncbi:hypothetical protein [Luteimonas terrae]|uniref:Uncharacterized protein n=1 Tax=Luteimonas terrae TaxID=1530191 RepID=A0A4R5UBR1_9GAMM|nr:hypothetical protein [Luteimonas terrae]TDK32667.1 hypothetical protein E2F49_00885 [Luteimonas terrae]